MCTGIVVMDKNSVVLSRHSEGKQRYDERSALVTEFKVDFRDCVVDIILPTTITRGNTMSVALYKHGA
jgi:hypothetical protein